MAFSEETMREISCLSPDMLARLGVLRPVPGKSNEYICPFCENGGRGNKDATGIVPKIFTDHVGWKCHRCGESFNNLAIFSKHYNLSPHGKDFISLVERICQDSGIAYEFDTPTLQSKKFSEEKKDSLPPAELNEINNDLESDTNSLIDFLSDCGGLWRGLTKETLLKFGCRYIKDWTPPKGRAAHSFYTPTPRVIIPANSDGLHSNYLARLTVPVDSFDAESRKYVIEKVHAGHKTLFNPAALTTKPFICYSVEGYIDAMSIEQTNRRSVATGGADSYRLLVDAVGNLKEKPIFIILFDNDDAGKKNAQKLKAQLKAAGCEYVACCFLEPGQDANQILQDKGEEYLGRKLEEILDEAIAKWDSELKLQNALQSATIESVKDPSSQGRHFEPPKEFSGMNDNTKSADNQAGINSPPTPSPRLYKGSPPTPSPRLYKGSPPTPSPRLYKGLKYFTTSQVAQIIGVDKKTVRLWRESKKFCEDIMDHDGTFLYSAERVMQLKAVYRRDWEKAWRGSSSPGDFENEFDFSLYEGDGTDFSNGKRIATFCKDKIRWKTDDEIWLTYARGIWLMRSEKNSVIMPLVNSLHEALKKSGTTKRHKGIANIYALNKKVNAAIPFVKGCSEILIKSSDLNKHKNLLSVQNGVVDLQTGAFYPHSPDYLITNQAAVVREEEVDVAASELVAKFLADILPDLKTRQAVVRYLAYCLTGEKPYHISHFWRGSGANGKSTLIDFVMKLFGTYAVKMPAAVLMESRRPPDGNCATPAISQLDGDIRLAIADELPRNARLAAALYKSITGDETISARALYHNPKKIELRAKLILNGNHLPTFDSDDGGLMRRINNVEFTEKFTGDRADSDLPKKLSAPKARSAFLNILIEEAKAFYREGLIESDAMKEAKAAYIAESDFVQEFIEEHCIVGEGGEITRKCFEEKLRECYPRESARLKKKELLELIVTKLEKLGGHYMKAHANRNVIRNVRLIDNES